MSLRLQKCLGVKPRPLRARDRTSLRSDFDHNSHSRPRAWSLGTYMLYIEGLLVRNLSRSEDEVRYKCQL